MRDAYRIYRQASGKKHPEDKPAVPFPRGLEYLWAWFSELEGSRPIAEGFLLPIPASQYLAWAQLSGVSLRPWQLMVLRAIDAAAMKVAMEK